MNAERSGRNIQLVEDGHLVAVADIETAHDPTVISASLHSEAGHRPVGASARLVDAVLDLDETQQAHTLQVTLPLGDVEALQQLRSRCSDVQTRPAGATCLVDAELPDPR